MTVRPSVVSYMYGSQTVISLLGHEPGDVFSILHVYCCKVTWRMEKTSPGLCLSKETSVWTFIVISDYEVANQQYANIIMFNDLKFCHWRCLVGVLICRRRCCGFHRKTSAGTLFLIFLYKVTGDIKCWLYDDSLYQTLLISNQDCWSYLKVKQGSGVLRHGVLQKSYLTSNNN